MLTFPNRRRFHHAFVKAGKWFHPGQILFRSLDCPLAGGYGASHSLETIRDFCRQRQTRPKGVPRHRYTAYNCVRWRLSHRPDEVGAKNVEAQAHRAINDDCLLGVFAHLSIQRDDEHLSLRLWCPTSKPICDLPRAMNCAAHPQIAFQELNGADRRQTVQGRSRVP